MLIEGSTAIDDRGKLSFFNDFNFESVKRFYIVENHQKNFIRAWHGHKKEEKYVYVSRGVAIVVAINMDDNEDKKRYILSGDKPQILHIPAGYYNGFKTLTDDTQVVFFSTSTIKESQGDDFRVTANKWKHMFKVEKR